MDRIIVINTHKFMAADQLTKLRRHVEGQLPAEGFVVLVLPEGVTAQEIGLGAERVDNVDAASLEQPAAEATTTSLSGKPVEHVDLSGEDEPIRFVWLRREQSSDDQRLFAIGQQVKDDVPLWAISIEQLTPEQMTKFSNRVVEM